MRLRRISTKFVLAVLAAVVLPFAAFALFVDQEVATRSLDVVKQALLGLATDLAAEVDRELEVRRREIALWTADPRAVEAAVEAAHDPGRRGWGPVETLAVAAGRRPGGPGRDARREQTLAFDRYVENSRVYDLLLLVDAEGRLAVSSFAFPDGRPLPPDLVRRLFAHDFSAEPWFERARADGEARVDNHRCELLDLPRPAGPDDVAGSRHVGLARALTDEPGGRFAGVLYGLLSWETFDGLLRAPLVKDYFRGMVPEDVVPSPYAWIWGSDADTILAHQNPGLVGERVSGPVVDLPEMVADARSGEPGAAGLFREYEFQGVRKNAAYQQCATPEEGGFGWYVGVGINNEDIFAVTDELTGLLYKGTAGVLLACVLWVLVVARRTTSPILALQEHTKRVAEGDLDARIEIDSKDELGELAEAFNRMTRDLAENRQALIKAEKDAAWREMARQIAHDIKNPLTPIRLSLDLLQRARREGRSDLDAILDRTLGLMERQVANLREIATDFYEFTGGRKPVLATLPTEELVAEVVELHAAWAEELGVEIAVEGPPLAVRADAGKLRRVLTNLVSNALQAMPDGGRLVVRVVPRGAAVRIEILDTGSGLSAEARERLFEPFFTTKSEGTGLGLAIAKRVIEEMGGTIEVDAREGGGGTAAHVDLPAAAPGPPSGTADASPSGAEDGGSGPERAGGGEVG